jgi:hypothetical protein
MWLLLACIISILCPYGTTISPVPQPKLNTEQTIVSPFKRIAINEGVIHGEL